MLSGASEVALQSTAQLEAGETSYTNATPFPKELGHCVEASWTAGRTLHHGAVLPEHEQDVV